MLRELVAIVSLATYGVCQAEIAEDRLPEAYQVLFGSDGAPHRIEIFYSFDCPSCCKLFRDEYEELDELVQSREAVVAFHPVVVTEGDVQGMECLRILSDHQKRVFLIALLKEIVPGNIELNVELMKTAMEVFQEEFPDVLSTVEKTRASKALQDGFTYGQGKQAIKDVPTVIIDGKVLPEVPSLLTIRKYLGEKS